MTEELTTKVTTINGRHHIRLVSGEKVLSEVACKLKEDIGWCCAYLLRWHAKLGGTEEIAWSSRHRGKRSVHPKGKVWYPSQIPVIKR
jgi:hypothetical protein